ncbi:23S rRNA pseudouridine(2605) synthase RluB [Rickettsiella massiliensis]|uniref:23S rRNA pseudouridine(2605) synthase RluB n=1 Tax=Rickettsiella massiliensis TaxID=676517 RepID=UPI00029A800F|nr:pseudouridine synthase [Rickettsiella massiliensis]
MQEKIQKVLARLGLASRREVERWIEQGRIQLNGKTAQLGDRMDMKSVLTLDDRPVTVAPAQAPRRVLLYHKPEGEICTRHDPENRPSVFSRLPTLIGQRWIMVGRLDINTLGLLLFTNDGELAHRLSHPSYEIEREYAVRILGSVDKVMLRRLKEGVHLEDGLAAFTQIEAQEGQGANRWYHVVLKEGRNREVRRLWESQGVVVSRLIRIRFASIGLPNHLKRGQWLELSASEVNQLAKQVKLA